MINGKKVLAVIPARGGSKGIHRKNIREVGNKPLIVWTIQAAQKSKYIDRCILSSDDQEIISVASKWGCEAPFVRPMELSQDDTPGIEPVIHAINIIPGYEYIVLLQPTSPLRVAADIDSCLELCAEKNAMACVSVCESDKSPYWMFSLNANGTLAPLLQKRPASRRQELPPAYSLNGAIYVARCDWIQKSRSFLTDETIAFLMPKDRSLDIDTELDCAIANFLLTQIL